MKISGNVARFEVESAEENDRRGEFFPEMAHKEWEKEEPEEKRRMMEDRWAYMERNMAPGGKCEERIEFEKKEEAKRKEQEEAEEHARLKREERKRRLMEAR